MKLGVLKYLKTKKLQFLGGCDKIIQVERIWWNGRHAGFRFLSERVEVQVLLSAPNKTFAIFGKDF